MPIQYAKLAKVTIVGLEIKVDLTAQYNPKEVQIEKSVNWTASTNDKADLPELDYSSGGSRSLSMELLFDTYEDAENGQVVDVSEKYVSKLMQLISVMDPDAPKGDKKRPSVVAVQWPLKSEAPFRGVLQSVSTKYTMFSACGRPVRAVCTVKLLEVTGSFDRRSGEKEPRVRPHRGW